MRAPPRLRSRAPSGTDAPPALLVGLDSLSGLQAARLLAARGVRVIAIASNPRHPACRTRVCDRILFADSDGEELIELLLGLGQRGDAGVVLPCTDRAVRALSRHRDRLEPAHTIPLPDHRTVETLLDKAAFAVYATREGLPIPRTALLEDRDDAGRAGEELRFPCVVKPGFKSAEWLREVERKVIRVATPAELLEVHGRFGHLADVFVAQEWIEGDDSALYSCTASFDRDGRPLASLVYRKLRQWPPETGNGTLTVECRNDAVREQTLRLFGDLRCHGFGDLEMKRDARTGELLITEPNVGRPVGLSPLAEACGVELLATVYRDAAGLPLPANRTQRPSGIKWVYLRNDLRSALALRREGRLTVRDWMRSLRGRRTHAVLSLRDPLPLLDDLWRIARKLARRAAPAQPESTTGR